MSHLDVAVAFKFLPDPERIRTNDDLSYLRIQPSFKRLPNVVTARHKNCLRPARKMADDTDQPDLLEQLASPKSSGR